MGSKTLSPPPPSEAVSSAPASSEGEKLAPAQQRRGVPRVAFLADSFHEVNGAARTSRQLAAFAHRNGYPFFSVRFAKQASYTRESVSKAGPFWVMEFQRGPLSIGVDPDLRFDLAFLRLGGGLERRLREFAPDLIHVMAPGELGILG